MEAITARMVRRRRALVFVVSVVSFALIAVTTGASFYLAQPSAVIVAGFLPVYLICLAMTMGTARNQNVLARPVMGRVVLALLAFVIAIVVLACCIPLALPPAWTSPRWPGVHEAAFTPDACAVVSEATLARLVPAERTPESGVSTGTGDPEHSTSCTWEAAGTDTRHLVTLEVYRPERNSHQGATSQASDQVASWLHAWSERNGAPTIPPVEGLGDDASAAVQTDPTGRFAETMVFARRANVAVRAYYQHRPPEGERPDAGRVRQGALEVARAAIDGVALG